MCDNLKLIVHSFHSADIQKLCSAVQKRVLDEIVDRDVEKGVCTPLLKCTSRLAVDWSYRSFDFVLPFEVVDMESTLTGEFTRECFFVYIHEN